MQEHVVTKFLRLNLEVKDYRALYIVDNQYSIDRIVGSICSDGSTNLKYFVAPQELRNVDNNARVRFVTTKVGAEKIMGMKIDHVIIDDFNSNSSVLSYATSRVNNQGCIIKVDN